MEGTTTAIGTIMGSMTTAVTELAESVFQVVTSAFANTNMLALVGLGIGFAVLAWGISLIPRYR